MLVARLDDILCGVYRFVCESAGMEGDDSFLGEGIFLYHCKQRLGGFDNNRKFDLILMVMMGVIDFTF